MSKIFSSLWNDPWEEMELPSKLFDQHFGTIIPEYEIARASFPPFNFSNQARCPLAQAQSECSTDQEKKGEGEQAKKLEVHTYLLFFSRY